VPGSPGQTYYYAPDQIGSVRRVFESASIAPAYDYDPWGNLLQVTPPPTDFGFAGMFNEPDSGLYLTQYRAYDPVAGRWLSRDPINRQGHGVAARMVYGSRSQAGSGLSLGDIEVGTQRFADSIPPEEDLLSSFGLSGGFPVSARFQDELNPYIYVYDDPVDLIDPTDERLRDWIAACGMWIPLITGNIHGDAGTAAGPRPQQMPPDPTPITIPISSGGKGGKRDD
jgi:RHS repeat-associated protein